MAMAIARRPEFGMGHPIWWHHHGWKMMLKRIDLRNRVVVIGSRQAAVVRITPKADSLNEGWYVEWEIKFARDSSVHGNVWMSSQNLECAFGLSDSEDKKYHECYRNWLISRFGADCACQGQFIRYGNFLNIPGPGTSNDGDPNVSIDLDDEIKDAVRQLLA